MTRPDLSDRRRTTSGRRAAALTLACLLALLPACLTPSMAAPVVPASDAEVLDRLPTAGDQAAFDLRRMHTALARQPGNLALALEVARRDVTLARARFDPRFNGYAQSALAPWWNQAPPPRPVLLLRATIRQSNHDFDAALADLDALIAADPANAQALLTRAVVHQVRAEYPAATADCRALVPLHAAFAADICAASVRGVGRDAAAAYQALQAQLEQLGPDAPASLRAWALGVLAELAARTGDAAGAERWFRAARAADPRDGYLLGAYADFLLDTNRPAEVVTLLADQTRIDPLLLRLAIAERRLGAPEAEAHVADLADRFAASAARGETVHRREEARFTLVLRAQPARALDLAVANWQVQREQADAQILLECALAAGRPQAAAPALRWLDDTGVPDPALLHLAQRLRG